MLLHQLLHGYAKGTRTSSLSKSGTFPFARVRCEILFLLAQLTAIASLGDVTASNGRFAATLLLPRLGTTFALTSRVFRTRFTP